MSVAADDGCSGCGGGSVVVNAVANMGQSLDEIFQRAQGNWNG
jgi:hypothetical protein